MHGTHVLPADSCHLHARALVLTFTAFSAQINSPSSLETFQKEMSCHNFEQKTNISSHQKVTNKTQVNKPHCHWVWAGGWHMPRPQPGPPALAETGDRGSGAESPPAAAAQGRRRVQSLIQQNLLPHLLATKVTFCLTGHGHSSLEGHYSEDSKLCLISREEGSSSCHPGFKSTN